MIRTLTTLCSFWLVSAAFAQESAVIADNPQPFGLWVTEFKREAVRHGISSDLLERAFVDIRPNERIIELDRKQPESTKTFTEYLDIILSDKRISRGIEKYAQHREILTEVSARYGVPAEIIVALWGTETHYGKITGGFSVIESLATLAYDGRRSDFFRKELMTALKIAQAGHIGVYEMQGSWAGAMGHCQFMPSSFVNFAVDYNQDGRKDIWGSLPDVFGSIANYLSESGWNPEYGWGMRVQVSAQTDLSLGDGQQFHPPSFWAQQGITMPDGSSLQTAAPMLAMSIPGEPEEGVYLVTPNYDVLLKWNRSRYFATAVSLLSEKIAAGAGGTQ